MALFKYTIQMPKELMILLLSPAPLKGQVQSCSIQRVLRAASSSQPFCMVTPHHSKNMTLGTCCKLWMNLALLLTNSFLCQVAGAWGSKLESLMVLSEFYMSVKIPASFGLTLDEVLVIATSFFNSVFEQSHCPWQKSRMCLVLGAQLAELDSWPACYCSVYLTYFSKSSK